MRPVYALRCVAIGVITVALLLGTGEATAADSETTPDTDISATPSDSPAAGPEVARANNSRPVSGRNPSAGPPFTQTNEVWQVDRTTVVLRNKVTDADGDRSTLTFQVWTTDANGNPKNQVMLTDKKHPNDHGVLVSDYVDSGQNAQRTVEYGDLKTATTYMFRTSAFDGSLYETDWSPWATFHVRRARSNIKLPEPNKDAPALNQDDFQNPQKISQPEMTLVPPDPVQSGTMSPDGRKGWNCGNVNVKNDVLPCTRIIHDNSDKTRDALAEARMGARSAGLVDWCVNLANSHIKRFEGCIGSFTFEYEGIVIKDGKPTGEIINASWAVGQEYKLSNTAGVIKEKMLLVPTSFDAKFVSVTLDVKFDCLLATDCTTDTSSMAWDGALEWTVGDLHAAEGTVTHNWNGGAEAGSTQLLDLSAKINAYSPLANPAASRWQADDAQIRCDTVSRTTPGCTFHNYTPTWVMNFNKAPAAVAHAWLIQSKLPNHPGSKAHNKPMQFLPVASKNEHNRDPDDNRKVICPRNSDGTGWAKRHANPDTTTLPEISPSDTKSCDEFAYAASYNSGGMPTSMGGLNEVSSGDECVQTFATRLSEGQWRLYDDWRLPAPTWNEVCGRSAMSTWMNTASMGVAFSNGFSGKYRLLDQDEYWVDFPEFSHCDPSPARVWCTIPQP
ncbi:hypothetical protein [Streptomyces synnematoformans]